MLAVLVVAASAIFNPLMEMFRNKHTHIYLPGGYELYSLHGIRMSWRPSSEELKLVANNSDIEFPDKRTIGPNIDGYRAYKNVITGHIRPFIGEPTQEIEFSPSVEKRTGYFIVEIDTKKVYGGLGKRDWIRMLKTYGIDKEPALRRFSWRDQNSRLTIPQAEEPK